MNSLLKNREEAGLLLAERLKKLNLKNVLVLAIPRGGIVLGYKVAGSINAKLDIITPRKLSDPDNPELAIGAVIHDGSTFLNEEIITTRAVSSSYVGKEKERQMQESSRRLTAYRGRRSYPKIKGQTVVLVDDGIATGATMIVAARWVKRQGAARVIVAVPVIPEEMLNTIEGEADQVVYLQSPEFFYAIGQFYEEFEQVEDSEVIRLLNEYWKESIQG